MRRIPLFPTYLLVILGLYSVNFLFGMKNELLNITIILTHIVFGVLFVVNQFQKKKNKKLTN